MSVDEQLAIEKWVQLCRWLRQTIERGRSDLLPFAFGTLFPVIWRGESNFAPIKAKLLRNLLGDNWYERIYTDRKAIILTPEIFRKWQLDRQVVQTVAENLQFWSDSVGVKSLSAVGICKLLQAAYDFQLTDLFRSIWSLATTVKMNPDESALLYQVY